MKYRLIKAEKFNQHDILYTLETRPGPIRRLFGQAPTQKQFYGGGTVFFSYPGCKRCGTDMEYMLCEFREGARVLNLIEEGAEK